MRLHLPVFLFAALISMQAYAGAWTQDPGKAQLIVTASYYNTNRLFDNGGTLRSQPSYSKHELNPYFEYGLYDGITLGANLLFQRASQSGQSNWGMGDSELFLRARLLRYGDFVLSIEPMVKLPSPDNGTPRLGGEHADVGLGVSAGYSFSFLGQHHFVALDLQQRHRFGSPHDQFRANETLGIGLSDRWMILGQSFITLRQDKPSIVTFTQSPNDDYGLLKLQLSAVYKIDNDLSLQAGAFDNVVGSNVGAGRGVLLSAWKSF